MRHFPDGYGGISDVHLDPLERARLNLDFEAMNAGSPSVKQVLFKAQTMGPLAPVREMPRFSWPGAALAFVLLALLVPWMPIDTSLTVMSVGFEESLPRNEANKLASHLLRNQPDNVLIGTQFSSTDFRQGINIDGQLRVTLTAFNVGERELEARYRDQIRGYQGKGLDPMFRLEHQAAARVYRSPLQQFERVLRPRSRGEAELPGKGEIERLLTGNGPLFAQALAPRIESVEPRVKLRDFEFTQPGDRGHYDITLPAWPRPIGLRMDNYAALTAREQSVVRQAAQQFIDQASLTPQADVILPTAEGLALRVIVLDLQGRADQYLSGQVQAWLSQPADSELQRRDYVPDELIAAAMDKALPGVEFQTVYDDRFEQGLRRITATIHLQYHGDRDKRDEDARRVESAAAAPDEAHIF